MHVDDTLKEANRLMTVCNSCRYCEGLCAVFPAMEMRRAFSNGDLSYLAHLCHNCTACYHDCQFSPPHQFDVNVPKVLAELRGHSYQIHVWPRALSSLFNHNGLAVSLATTLSVALFIIGFTLLHDPDVLFSIHSGSGAFYALLPHHAIVALFGVAFLYAIVALAMGVRNFWTAISEPMSTLRAPLMLWQAIKDACSLRYLDGGGSNCMIEDETPTNRRRIYHHFTFYGFLLCFAATSLATLYHYLLGIQAPYPWYDLPVLLGTCGGIGLLIGPAGLLAVKWKRDPATVDRRSFGMEVAFLVILFLTSLTGLALLVLRATPAMGLMLALHLGVVFSLFLTLPYGKFVHGIYRFAALVRYAKEKRALEAAEGGTDP